MTPSNAKHLQLPVSLHANTPVQTYTLVDSGASGNYISRQLYNTLSTGRRHKQQPYQLVIANRQTELVCHETQPMEIVTGHHAERIHLDIVKLATQDIYLGMPWLKKHKPVVNWRTGVLTFRNCTNNTAQTCYQPQKVWTDKGRSPQWNLTDRKDDSQEKRSASTGTPQNQVAKQSEMKREEVVNSLEIPEKY